MNLLIEKMIKYYFILFSVIYLTEGRSKVLQLNEDNWTDMLKGEWMVEFFAPWCPACKGLQPIWEDFASWSDDLDIRIAQVDVTASPGLSGRFMVTALPTIYHVKDGEFRQYRGARDKDELISFVEEKKYQSVEPIPGWKSPASFQMSAMSYFFKLSMTLRSIHTVFIEEYGLPYWGSYIIFALATIIVGAILGLILVCIVDFLYPQKTTPSPVQEQASKPEEPQEDEDLVEENIEDDSQGSQGEESAEDNEGTQESQESQTESDKDEVSSSPSVRKRKTRKAD